MRTQPSAASRQGAMPTGGGVCIWLGGWGRGVAPPPAVTWAVAAVEWASWCIRSSNCIAFQGHKAPEAVAMLNATIGTRSCINSTQQLLGVQLADQHTAGVADLGAWPGWMLYVFACRASKAALNIINKALVMDLSEQKVDCVLMHPGYVKTDMTGMVALGNHERHCCSCRCWTQSVSASYCSRILPMPRLVLATVGFVCCWQVVQDTLRWRRASVAS